MPLHLKTRFLFLAGLGALSIAAWACTSRPEPAKDAKTAASGPKEIEHEKCDSSVGRAVSVDADRDGKPELTQVYDKTSGRKLCRMTDLNHDGKPDMYEYYNADGSIRRREGAYDSTDAISEVQIFENGKLVRRERDTTGQRKIDTWDTYDPESGKLLKRERDNNGDGKVDQWWTWDGNNITIAIDKNGDGQPDPNETMTVGPNGQAIASATASASAPSDAGAQAPIAPPPNPPVIMPSASMVDAGAKKKTGGAKK